MSKKDLDRLEVLKCVEKKELKQIDAARILGISDRQVRKLITRLRNEGPKGIISRLVGKESNRKTSSTVREQVLTLVKEKYEGFGPTLVAEKLFELDGMKISNETLRKWMVEEGLWISRKRRVSEHLPRLRRSCFGELIQADGSPDHWFGPDLSEVNATVFIDDATSAITALYFSKSETTEAYFLALEEHLVRYGRPIALYTDRSRIFKSQKDEGITQMGRALSELGIESILAYSPQAKGRVERANRTLQDRLKKEFKLRGITTIEEANEYAKEFIGKYNEMFSKRPMSEYDAHRSLEGYDLERILCRKEERSLDCLGTFQFKNVHYKVQGISGRRVNGKRIEVRETRSMEMRVFLDSKEVKVLPLNQVMQNHQEEMDRKQVLRWRPRVYRPGPDHPWKKGYPKAINT